MQHSVLPSGRPEAAEWGRTGPSSATPLNLRGLMASTNTVVYLNVIGNLLSNQSNAENFH